MFVGGRRLGLMVMAALIAFGGVGCSGSSDSPAVLPPVSTTPTPTQSSPPAQSPKAAAVAVVREYFDLLNHLSSSMDPASFAALETSDCPCRKFIRSLKEVRNRGQHYFGHATVTSLTATTDSAASAEVLVSYDASPGGIKDGKGHVVARQPGRVGATENFYLRKAGGRWLVANILLVKRGHLS